MDDDYIKKMNEYIEKIKELRKTNPELSRKMAKDGLKRAGIIDDNGNLIPPYNGQRVNEDDFTRGPGEMNYREEER